MKYTFEELNRRYEEFTSKILCKCEMATPLAGGLPANEEGIRAFIIHHLHLEGAEAEQAVLRIQKEELGERPIPEAEGELNEKLTYGVNVIRKTKLGPYLGSWMVHSNLKQAA